MSGTSLGNSTFGTQCSTTTTKDTQGNPANGEMEGQFDERGLTLPHTAFGGNWRTQVSRGRINTENHSRDGWSTRPPHWRAAAAVAGRRDQGCITTHPGCQCCWGASSSSTTNGLQVFSRSFHRPVPQFPPPNSRSMGHAHPTELWED